jgi:hypothetical protein
MFGLTEGKPAKGSRIIKRAMAVAVLAMAVGAALGAAPASAQPVVNGSLSFSGDPGDWVSGGQSYAYSTANGDQLTVSGDGSHMGVSVNGFNGDWWSLDLDAPADQQLAPGTYDRATRYPFNGAGPGLSLFGNGRGCNTVTGSFTIQRIAFGPHGYIHTLDATYEQHCEGGSSALRGEVRVENPPPPTELGLGLTVSTVGTASTVNGRAYIHGTVSCTVPARVTVNGTVSQAKRRVLIRGTFSTAVDCVPGPATAWSASADPTGTTPFQRGAAEARTFASAIDPQYGNLVSVDQTIVVTLKRSRTP